MSEAKQIIEEILEAYKAGMSEGVTSELLLDWIEKNPTNITELKETRDEVLYRKICNKKVLTLDELWSLPTQPDDYLIDGILYKKQVAAIVAESKVGKTILALQMALSLTGGQSFLNTFEVGGEYKVLYAISEMSREAVKKRTQSMSKAVQMVNENFTFHYGVGMELHLKGGYQYLSDLIYESGQDIDVLFIDPIYKSIGGGDVCSNIDMTIFTNNLDMIKEKHNCSIILVHHKRKGGTDKNGKPIDGGDDAFMGSSILKNYVDHLLNMRVFKDGTRTLSCDTQREGNIEKKLELSLTEEPLHFSIKGQSQCNKTEQSILDILKCSDEPLSSGQLRVRMGGIAKSTFNPHLLRLKKQGTVEVKGKDKCTPLYGVK